MGLTLVSLTLERSGFMQFKIENGAVDLSGERILFDVNIDITDRSHIAVVGRNGCGKTTLLKLIAGEYELTKDNEFEKSGIYVSGKPKIGLLSQMTFSDDSLPLVKEIRNAYTEILKTKEKLDNAQREMEQNQSEENIKNYTNLLDTFTNLGGFYFEKEYEAALKSFGFGEKEKLRPLSEFSGGQRTKIAFLKLILSKPDILLLDEPTNHLDIEATAWLEEYLKNYKKAFVVVSHDRMFLDNTAEVIYEIERGKTYKYIGNYTKFTQQKKLLREKQQKEYEAQQKEIERLESLVERFRYKATKASMAQSKLKQLDKMEKIESPVRSDLKSFHGSFNPVDVGVKDMLSVENLGVGYDKILSTVDLEVKNGEKIGIIGSNGLGKSTFIRTLVGDASPISGRFTFSSRATIGYFDQQMAEYKSKATVLEDFMLSYPSYNDFEARTALGAFLFSGEDVLKTVDVLSGGERVRLALCKILNKRPNFLILDEPTNHMDIIGKETLEDILKDYTGTVIFVSHDRYFIKRVATAVLDFKSGQTVYYPYGYDEYLNKHTENKEVKETAVKPENKKKGYTTPLKEKAKRERAIKKCEEKIALLEERLEGILTELSYEENISDYIKLSELQKAEEETETELDLAYNEWERLSSEMGDG